MLEQIMVELEALGSPSVKRIYQNHGAPEPLFGVRVGDMKPIIKRIGKNYQLALDLYATGNSDAQYMAGLIADERCMTVADLQTWVNGATWYYLSEFAVPWVAAETPFARTLALEWMQSNKETTATAGWATYANLFSLHTDDKLNLEEVRGLLDNAQQQIHTAQNRVRAVMNMFVIMAGCRITALSDYAKQVARAIGPVEVNVGNTACKTPLAIDYIEKSIKQGTLTKRKKTVRC